MGATLDEINKRRTFAIISHPDAGKTTLTEKLLLFGRAILLAGTVKGRKASRHATSDWMVLEQQRGISVTTSVMQFPYQGAIVNLLDTPGHEDFSEDTYRTLTAVDSALMVIDAAKGVEARTIKLMEVCRLRTTPIMTFINKLDRDGQDPMTLLDEVEKVLDIQCAPVTWPIGMGKGFKGVYHLPLDEVILYETGKGATLHDFEVIKGLDNLELDKRLGPIADEIREEIELVKGASFAFDREAYLAGKLTPVFFGTALGNFGVDKFLDWFVTYAPAPLARETETGMVGPDDSEFSGFVFKIQANMDPQHRDRVAFMRVCSGQFQGGQKIKHVRIGKQVQISKAITFMASDRVKTDVAYAGDIIGLHNHGTIQIGDTFTQGKSLKFIGVPNFAPELFRKVRLKDPLKMKALLKGLLQLSEEGATQVFRPLMGSDLIVGAVGVLQFDVVAHRLELEYGVKCTYEATGVTLARWIDGDDTKAIETLKQKAVMNLALDSADTLTYLAPSMVNLQLAEERYPSLKFLNTREH